jgi:hypothetical protein
MEVLEEEGLVERSGDAWTRIGRERQQRRPRWLGGYEARDETFAWDAVAKRLVHRS